MPKDLDSTLQESVNIWFSGERTMEVLVEVDPSWAHYFQRRQILPQQKVEEEKHDGSLLVRFLGSSNEEVVMCLKPWLPHMRVIHPNSIRELLLDEYGKWLDWQRGVLG